VSVREFFRKRRQRKARKRYEQERARQEVANDPQAVKRAENFVKDIAGGL